MKLNEDILQGLNAIYNDRERAVLAQYGRKDENYGD